MKILGIDPAVNRLGWGCVELSRPGSEKVLQAGVIVVPPQAAYTVKMARISQRVDGLLCELQPDVVVLEEIYLAKNVQIALKIGQVMGIVISAAMRHDLTFELISPRSIKQNITGRGSASKEQVQYMLGHMTGYKDFKSTDESDAVAAAVSYIICKRENDLLRQR